MFKTFGVLSGLVAATYGAPVPQNLPAGVSHCNNYPFCYPDPTQLALPGAAQHAAAIAQLKQAEYALIAPTLPDVPGIAQHQAAEQAVKQAIARQNPVDAYANTQAERELIALQQQHAAASAFTGLVGPSGSIGPAGLVGPGGAVAF